jgi:hypothetical protein
VQCIKRLFFFSFFCRDGRNVSDIETDVLAGIIKRLTLIFLLFMFHSTMDHYFILQIPSDI